MTRRPPGVVSVNLSLILDLEIDCRNLKCTAFLSVYTARLKCASLFSQHESANPRMPVSSEDAVFAMSAFHKLHDSSPHQLCLAEPCLSYKASFLGS